MTVAPDPEIESCSYLFVLKIEELDHNGLRLMLAEGKASPIPESISVAGTLLSDLHRVTSTGETREFEVVWDLYVAYSVRNESYATFDENEVACGGRFRVYSKSRFLDFICAATFATDEYPGPMCHIGINCEDHIIDVVSTKEPRVKRLRPVQLPH